MSAVFSPRVEPEIFALRPDYRALSICASNVRNTPRHALSDGLLAQAGRNPPPPWADAHLESWREAYRAFGAKPQRTPCSAEALIKRRAKDGCLPQVNAVVDLYNALSVWFAIPIGGENRAAYVGSPQLVRAGGQETFDTTKDGEPFAESVPAGEVVWRDTQGVTCRRWNWRQCVRTRIDESTSHMWFVLERLEPMPVPALLEAGERLTGALVKLTPAAQITQRLIERTEDA